MKMNNKLYVPVSLPQKGKGYSVIQDFLRKPQDNYPYATGKISVENEVSFL